MQLPQPSGSWPVGTTTVQAGDAKHPITLHVWYPTGNRTGTRARYLRDEPALAELRRANPGLAARLLVDGVTTHATLDAPVAAIERGLPVLVFSHGYLSLPGDYTALMEDLASHGFAVFSLTHPYETAATSIGDGRVALAFGAKGPNELTGPVLAEWEDEEAASAAVTGAADRVAAERAMREYLGRIPKSTEAIARWVEDSRVAVDRIVELARTDSGERFAGKLDLARLGAFGHSMGGITSAAFCARDPRCRASLNLDGSPQYGDLIDRPGSRPLLMVYAARPGRIGVSDLIYGKSDSAWRAVITGTLHLNFGDFQYRQGSQRFAPVLGPIAADRSTSIVHRLVREWFDQMLSGKASTLLAGGRVFEELEVRRIDR